MSLIQSLCLLLIAAQLLARLATRLGQPEMLGHIVAGIVLGPAMLGWVTDSAGLNAVADFAVLFVVIAAGLEMRLRAVAAMFKGRSLLALLPSFLLPAISGWALANRFHFTTIGATVVALCVSVTALPVALRILSSFGLLTTRLAQVTIAGALLADVFVLLTLGVLIADTHSTRLSLDLLFGLSALRLLALLGCVGLGVIICKAIYKRTALQPQRLAATQLWFALLLILCLAGISDALGFHFAIGAFLGALTVSEFHSMADDSHPLRHEVEGLSNHVFAPLFLASQGAHFTTGSLTQPLFIIALIIVAIGSKLIGGYWTGRLSRLPHHDAKGVAIVMNARGVMEMVVASIAYRAGLVDAELFSALLIVGVVTTLCTPLLLQRWQKQSATVIGVATKAE